MKKYYLGYKGTRIGVELPREEAIMTLFRTRGAFKDLCIMVYDENDKFIRQIPKPKKK